MVDEEAFLNIIDQMRITIPQEIKQAREVQLEREKYVAQAREEARRIVAQAREDAAQQLDEHALRQAAETRAEAIVTQAQREAARIRSGADDYAQGRLQELAQEIDQLQQVIQNGLEALGRRQQQRAQQTGEPAPQAAQSDTAE
jgi:vacuolar-type H+-ATPase subunit H